MDWIYMAEDRNREFAGTCKCSNEPLGSISWLAENRLAFQERRCCMEYGMPYIISLNLFAPISYQMAVMSYV